VNAETRVTDPPGVVSTKLFAPTVPAGAVTTTTVLVIDWIEAVTPPIVTLLVPMKFDPDIVTAVPLVNGPEVGLTEVIVGGGAI